MSQTIAPTTAPQDSGLGTAPSLTERLAAFLAATTPQTDAARLAAFLRPLFHDIAEKERDERELLMRGAKGMLSGDFRAER